MTTEEGPIPTKLKYICWTLYNYTEADEKRIAEIKDFNYYVYGKEICPTTGRPHLQGYCQIKGKKYISLSYFKKIMGRQDIHVEKSFAKLQVFASNYCKKGEQPKEEYYEFKTAGPNYGKNADVTEWGEMGPGQGTRTDLLYIKTQILEEKKPLDEVVRESVENFQQLRFAEALWKYIPLSEEWLPKEVHWFYGPTGCGKTKEAYAMIQGRSWWRSGRNDKWFHNYWGQEVAIIEELRPGNWEYPFLLQLTGDREIYVEYKGGFCIWKPKVIIITTPETPEQTYKGQVTYHDNIDQLIRRLNKGKNIREFKVPVAEPTDVQVLIDELSEEEKETKRKREEADDFECNKIQKIN